MIIDVNVIVIRYSLFLSCQKFSFIFAVLTIWFLICSE